MALFGADIRGIIGDAFIGELNRLTLTKSIIGNSTKGSLTAGPTITETEYECDGIISDKITDSFSGQPSRTEGEEALIIGASLPDGIEPQDGDFLTYEGKRYIIGEVSTDPDNASHICDIKK